MRVCPVYGVSQDSDQLDVRARHVYARRGSTVSHVRRRCLSPEFVLVGTSKVSPNVPTKPSVERALVYEEMYFLLGRQVERWMLPHVLEQGSRPALLRPYDQKIYVLFQRLALLTRILLVGQYIF
jgi:hypothetical protein